MVGNWHLSSHQDGNKPWIYIKDHHTHLQACCRDESGNYHHSDLNLDDYLGDSKGISVCATVKAAMF